MAPEFLYFIETVLNGLMAGVMYSLVALGFVLIFKASGIFNFAQGVMALFAALTLVGLQTGQVPFAHLINAIFGTEVHHFGWELPAVVAIAGTLVVMVAFAWLFEKLDQVRRHGPPKPVQFMWSQELSFSSSSLNTSFHSIDPILLSPAVCGHGIEYLSQSSHLLHMVTFLHIVLETAVKEIVLFCPVGHESYDAFEYRTHGGARHFYGK